jgi:hypothetical protein
LAISNKV